MNNYVYIIAGLPELTLAFENSGFSYDTLKNHIYPLLSEKDKNTVDFFEDGFDDSKLDSDFYKKALNHSNDFISKYFRFDLHSRNMKVNYLGKRLIQSVDKYIVEVDDSDFEDEKRVQAVFEIQDLMQREQQMDKLRWEKTSEIVRMEYFSLNVILVFLFKAKMIQRWAKLDKEKGNEMFTSLVAEVRGTFQGVPKEKKR